jgi:CubicO group peptidase (beta-lactamase class C family)
MRVASISKVATARAVVGAALDGLVDLDAPADRWLELPAPVPTVRHLLSHLSGYSDAAGYVIPPPEAPDAHVAREPAARPRPPGTWFDYANINYVLLGVLLERLEGDRFDRILEWRVLGPAGIGGGFNWAGVSDRGRRLALWQRHGEDLVLQVDGAAGAWDADLIWRNGEGVDLARWEPGHAAWFSPQGGLRASVAEAARLVRFATSGEAGRLMRAPAWVHDGANGEWCEGLFPAYGLGLTLLRSDRLDRPLVGHAGHALGFTGGAWLDEETGAVWALALTGAEDASEALGREAFFGEVELAALRAL